MEIDTKTNKTVWVRKFNLLLAKKKIERDYRNELK